MIFGMTKPEKIWLFWIVQGKVATSEKWGGQIRKIFVSNFLRILHTKITKIG